VADADEPRRFEEIVAPLRAEAPFADPPPQRSARRSHAMLIAGVVCCAAAAAVLLFGGVSGAVLAVLPWFAGMVLVVLSRGRA
jgi:hypothetical protein